MENIEINYWAVLVGGIIPMIVGFVYYLPSVFGKTWQALSGLSDQDVNGGPGAGYLLTFIGALLTAYILSHFVDYASATTFSTGALTGFWAWLGFTAMTSLANDIFSKKPLKLWAIQAGYHLITLTILGGVLAVWQ